MNNQRVFKLSLETKKWFRTVLDRLKRFICIFHVIYEQYEKPNQSAISKTFNAMEQTYWT